MIETDFGNISVRLYDETPLHRANFIKLIKDGYYDNPEFYRVVENFVVQGGVPLKKLDYTVPAEINPKFVHKKGALAIILCTGANMPIGNSMKIKKIWA